MSDGHLRIQQDMGSGRPPKLIAVYSSGNWRSAEVDDDKQIPGAG